MTYALWIVTEQGNRYDLLYEYSRQPTRIARKYYDIVDRMNRKMGEIRFYRLKMERT